MVTLNEMFGLSENEQRPFTEDAQMVPLQPYTRMAQVLGRGDYLHDVLLIQERLSRKGYLQGSYNGYFGQKTEDALKRFQRDAGLEVSGVCGRATWDALFQ